MLVGSRVMMRVHSEGSVTERVQTVIKMTATTITLNTDKDISNCYEFEILTGKCLNDLTQYGSYRTLKI